MGRLVLRNEAQSNSACWASQAQHQPTKEFLRHPLLIEEGFLFVGSFIGKHYLQEKAFQVPV
jgi:hypothetical protein